MDSEAGDAGEIEIVAVQGNRLHVSGWIAAERHDLLLVYEDIAIATPLIETSGYERRFLFTARIPVGFDDVTLLEVVCDGTVLAVTPSTRLSGAPPVFQSLDALPRDVLPALSSGKASQSDPGRHGFLFEMMSSEDSIDGVLVDLAAPNQVFDIHLMAGPSPLATVTASDAATLSTDNGDITIDNGFGIDIRAAFRDDLWLALGETRPARDDEICRKVRDLNAHPEMASGRGRITSPISVIATGQCAAEDVFALCKNLPSGSEMFYFEDAHRARPRAPPHVSIVALPGGVAANPFEAFLLGARQASHARIAWVRMQRAAGDPARAIRAAVELVARDGVGVANIAAGAGPWAVASCPLADGFVTAFRRDHLAPQIGPALDAPDDAAFERALRTIRRERAQDVAVGVVQPDDANLAIPTARTPASLLSRREMTADLFARPGFWTGAAPRILVVARGRHIKAAQALCRALRDVAPCRTDIRAPDRAGEAAPFDALLSFEPGLDPRRLTNGAPGFSAYRIGMGNPAAGADFHGAFEAAEAKREQALALARRIVSEHRRLAESAIRFAIKIHNPTDTRTFFLRELAECLADALREADHYARVDLPADWTNALSFSDDFVLVLGCADGYRHIGLAKTALWIVDDATLLTARTMDRFDHVFVATTTGLAAIAQLTSAPVSPLLPLLPLTSDDSEMTTLAANALIYIADYAGALPAGIAYALASGVPVFIHGDGWETRVPDATVKGPAPADENLWRIFSMGQAVLFDLAPVLARLGFLPLGALEALRMGSEPVWEDTSAARPDDFAALKRFSTRGDFERLIGAMFDAGAERDPALAEVGRGAEAAYGIETSAAALVEVARAALARG